MCSCSLAHIMRRNIMLKLKQAFYEGKDECDAIKCFTPVFCSQPRGTVRMSGLALFNVSFTISRHFCSLDVWATSALNSMGGKEGRCRMETREDHEDKINEGKDRSWCGNSKEIMSGRRFNGKQWLESRKSSGRGRQRLS